MKKILITVIILMAAAASVRALECKMNDNWSKMTCYENGKKAATWLYYDFGLVKEGGPLADGFVTVTAKSGEENISGVIEFKDNSIVNRVYTFEYETDDRIAGKYAEGKIEDDYMEGVWTYYHMTGKKAAEGIYHKNMKEGLWGFYDLDGYKEKDVYFEHDSHDLDNETDAFDWVKKKLMHLGEIKR